MKKSKIQSRKLWVAILGTGVLIFMLIFFKAVVTGSELKFFAGILGFFWSAYIGGNVLRHYIGRKKGEE